MAANYVKATKAELPTDASVPIDSKGWVPTENTIYKWDGDSWEPESTGGAQWVVAVGIGSLTDKGYVQITNLSSAVGIGTIPAGAKVAVIYAQDQDVRWRQDGTSPTATVGNLLPINSERAFGGDLTALKFIQVSASPAGILNVQFYG